MELNTSAVSGAMKVGLQIVSASKRPSIEVFSELRKIDRPMMMFTGEETRQERWTEEFVAFYAVNIGGRHAENISFDMSATKFERPDGHRWGPRIDAVVPVMSPGQTQFLFLLNIHEFNKMEWKDGVGRPVGIKIDPINIIVRFDGPNSGLNRPLRCWFNGVLKRKQYEFRYSFNPLSLDGDYPPVEYL